MRALDGRETSPGSIPFAGTWRADLARAERALTGVGPVLVHILASDGNSLISDAIVARVRGMLRDIARQLVTRLDDESSSGEDGLHDLSERLTHDLANDTTLLSHIPQVRH